MHHHGVDYAAWITALATVGALIAAIIASVKVYQLETARDAESKKIAKYAQAIQISGWITFNPDVEMYPVNQHTPSLVAIVKNPSQQPIFNIVITWYYKGMALSTDHAYVIKPVTGFHTFHILPEHLARLRADGYSVNSSIFQNLWIYPDVVSQFESTSGVIDIGKPYSSTIATKVSEAMSTQFQLFFSFTDIEGVRWQRDINGTLSESPVRQQ